MSQLPFIFEMDPEQWFIDVQKIAGELVEELTDALNDHDSAETLYEALDPVLQPYVIDPDDRTFEQLIAEVEGDTFYIGKSEEQRVALTHRDDGYWWFKRQEPDGQQEPEELHRRVAIEVVESVEWGDEERARQRAENQKAKRRMLEPYLQAVEEAGGREGSAEQLRGPLMEFVEACLPFDEDVHVEDRSPNSDFTDLVILREGKDKGHVLAVGPGESRKPERLQEAFGLDEISLEEGVLVVTDHLRFVWYPFLGTQGASNELILPSNRDDDVVDYYYEIDWTVTQMIRSLMHEG